MLVTRRRHRLSHWLERLKDAVKPAAAARLRALLPPITPKLILLALLGVLLFLCGLVYGAWLIVRFRYRDPHVG